MREKGEEAGGGWESCHHHAGLLWKRERERERERERSGGWVANVLDHVQFYEHFNEPSRAL